MSELKGFLCILDVDAPVVEVAAGGAWADGGGPLPKPMVSSLDSNLNAST